MGHKAIIAKIDSVFPIQNAEKIQVGICLGEEVIISKNIPVGYVGVFFPTEVQLSEQYCYENNLYRDPTKNKDISKKGFFEESRRVRAQKFMGVKSVGYFADLQSFAYAGEPYEEIGVSFDEINGHKICQKYISKEAQKQIASSQGASKARKANLFPNFEKHIDSEQFKHFAEKIKAGSILSFHAKVHGTSFRVGYLPETQPLGKFKKFVNSIFPIFPEKKMKYVVGTRNVVLSDPEKEGFHGKEAFRFEVMEALKPFLKEGMTVYGEIAGYANGAPIMPTHDVKALKNSEYIKKYGDKITYSYGCKPHEYRFHIYRITNLSVAGDNIEMPQLELDRWCKSKNLNGTFEVAPSFVYNGDVQALRDLVEKLTERENSLTEDFIDPNHISEGIIIRADTTDGVEFYKSKSYAFRVMEGHCEAVDEETIS